MPEWEMSSEANADTFTSIHAHFEAGTLATRLPKLELPALFIHGEADPFPAYVSHNTFELIRGAVLVELLDAGHFPWLERPGVIRGVVGRFLH